MAKTKAETYRLPVGLSARMERAHNLSDVPKSRLVVRALEEFLDRHYPETKQEPVRAVV